jgi:hypothetical protein
MAELTLPTESQGWWTAGTDVGVVGGIDTYRTGGASARTTLIDITQAPYNADNTGVASCATAIASAITAATTGQVIYLPTGTYNIPSTITVSKSNITFRGDGPLLTIISCPTDDLSSIFNVGGTDLGSAGSQTITGTRTKGTSTVAVASSSGYSAGQIVQIVVPEEEDSTRIQAGYPVTWTASGFRSSRRFFAKVTNVPNGTSITIDPPLPYDCTPYTCVITRQYTPLTTVGFEDLQFTSPSVVAGDHYTRAIQFTGTVECWAYNIRVTNWNRSTGEANGQPINIIISYKTEIRKCAFMSNDNTGDDGAIQLVGLTSGLIEDNRFHDWQNAIYDTPPTTNTVISYNLGFRNGEEIIFGHGTRYSVLNLLEGNIFRNTKPDGYHGGTFRNTFFRNWFRGWNDKTSVASYTLAINKFSHYYALVGNIFGMDGRSTEANAYGNPNIGNGLYSGDSDIVNGTPQSDWLITGTLITRNSDSSGVFTMSGGDPDGTSLIGGQPVNTLTVWWSSYSLSRASMSIASYAGADWTITGGSGTALPIVGTVCAIWTGQNGFQNRDLSVDGTMFRKENYHSLLSGTGAIEDALTPGDTLPVSFVHASKPAWFGALPWPPIDPGTPLTNDTTHLARIPAGYRYINGLDPTDAPPTLTFRPAKRRRKIF